VVDVGYTTRGWAHLVTGVTVIALDVVVIMALTVHGAEIKAGE
jgi:hypothetical protein